MYLNDEMTAYIEENLEELKQLIRELAVIPAPSHHEELRAEFCEKWFRGNGFEDVHTDEALNVIAAYGVPAARGPEASGRERAGDRDIVAFSAHTDVVFPDTEPLPFREDAERFYCPGVCDDTANLAVLMMAARYFVQRKIPAHCGMLFIANSCEEGLGNLKGIREIVRTYGARMREHISFDGPSLRHVVANAVGSHRYRVTVRTEGGHSYGAFGNRNAIRYLAGIIDSIYQIRVPDKEGTKTTYNVGTVEGGTSVNTIAQEASMLCEYRSDDRECLRMMENAFAEIFDAYRAMGVEVEVERVGERPCTGEVDPARHEELIARMEDAVRAVGVEPLRMSSSTDCNIPLSAGIPASCIGVVTAEGCHTREEWVEIASLPVGMRLAMEVMGYYFD